MRRLLGVVAFLVVAAAVGLGIAVAIHHRPGSGGPTIGPGSPTSRTATDTTIPVDIVPAPGQTFLTGTITSLTADNAIGPAIKPPFTITISSRGQGHADITGVLVGGQDVEIFWYGGQPLPVSGTGQLAIEGGPLIVNASGSTWMLDGAPRSLTTGHFNLGAPVAVGSGGLAQPHQSIAFDTDDRSTILTTGHAQIHLLPAPTHLTGPGSVTVHGDLQMQTATGTRQVQAVVFGRGSYEIDLTPTTSGDNIKATLQGVPSVG